MIQNRYTYFVILCSKHNSPQQYEITMDMDGVYEGEKIEIMDDTKLLEENGEYISYYDALTDYYGQTVEQDDFPYMSEYSMLY